MHATSQSGFSHLLNRIKKIWGFEKVIFKKASFFDLPPILENGIYIWANFGAVRINDCYKAEVLLTV